MKGVALLFIFLLTIVENRASSETSVDSNISNERLDRIEALLKEQTKRIQNLEHTIRVQNAEISLLKRGERTCKGEISYLKGVMFKKSEKMSKPKSDGSRISKIQKADIELELQKRLLIGITPPPIAETTTAFYAYMSKPEKTLSPHHILIFDAVKTHINGGYSGNTGIYTVPIDGVYVFTYSIRSLCIKSGGIEIVKNTSAEGATYMSVGNTNVCDQDHETGIIVVSANKGDEVYVRTHSTHWNAGDTIGSDENGRSSFGGWRIGNY